MTKEIKIILIIAVIVVIGVFVFKHYQQNKESLDDLTKETSDINNRLNIIRNKISDDVNHTIPTQELNGYIKEINTMTSRLKEIELQKKALINK